MNPSDPQKYYQDQTIQVFLVESLASQFTVSSTTPQGVTFDGSPAVGVPFASGYLREAVMKLDHCEFPTHSVPDISGEPGWNALTPLTVNVFACLYNPAGWGRNIDIAVDGPTSAGPIQSGQVSLFGAYTGDFSYRKSLYYQWFPLSGVAPLFPFAPDLLPLYSLYPEGDVTVSWPYPVGQPVSTDGHCEVQFSAVAGQDDEFQDWVSVFDQPSVQYNSGDRIIKLIYIPLSFTIADLRTVEGRAISFQFTVNGALCGETSVLRFSRYQALPALPDCFAKIDEMAHCDTLSGALQLSVPVFLCKGPGVPDRLDLVYSSESSLYYRDAAKEQDPTKFLWQPFGQGWGFTHGLRVIGPAPNQQNLDTAAYSNDIYLVQDASGRLCNFSRIYDDFNAPTSQFSPQTYGWWGSMFANSDTNVVLVELDNNGGFTLNAGDRSDTYTFDGTGRLVQIKLLRYGRPLSIAYQGDNFTVTDSSGRTTSYVAGGDGRITQVTDPGNKVWIFHYDGPSLIQIDSPDGTYAQFGYDETNFALASKTSRLGAVYQFSYLYDSDVTTRLLWGTLSGATCQDPIRGALTHGFTYQDGPAMTTIYGPNSFTVTRNDPRGHNTTFAVGVSGWETGGSPSYIVAITQPDTGWTRSLTYGGDGEFYAINYPSGGFLMNGYISGPGVATASASDALGTDASGQTTHTYTNEQSATEQYTYADYARAANLISKTVRSDMNGSQTLEIDYTWSDDGDMTQETETGGEVNIFEYYSTAGFLGLKQTVTHCFGKTESGVETYVFNEYGWLKSETTENGTLAYEYDAFGRVISETYTSGTMVTTRTSVLSADGLTLTVTDYDQSVNVITYDTTGMSQTETLTDADGTSQSLTYKYDANGNRTSIAHAGGDTYTITYDEMDRRLGLASALGSDAYQYDPDGNVSQIVQTDSAGVSRTTDYQFAFSGQLSTITHPAVPLPDGTGSWRPTASVAYYPNGRAQSVTKDVVPGQQAVTEYDLDPSGRPNVVRRKLDSGDFQATESLDDLGQIDTQSGPQFMPATAAVPVTVSGDPDIGPGEPRTNPALLQFESDCRVRLVSVADRNNNTIVQLSYNDADGLTQIQTPDPQVTGGVSLRPVETRTYDTNGRETSITTARGLSIGLSYDAGNRISSVTLPSGVAEGSVYDSDGNVISITRNAGWLPTLTSSYQHGPYGITQVQHTNELPSGAAAVQTYTITYDTYGRPIGKTDPLLRQATMQYNDFGYLSGVAAGGHTIAYAYDAMNRLIQTSWDGAAVCNFAYDASGNMTLAENGVTKVVWTYNPFGLLLNRSVTFKGPGFSKTTYYQYDYFGHLWVRRDDDGNKLRYGYDDDGRLTGVFNGTDTTALVQYQYNAAGLPSTRTLVRPGITTAWLYDVAGAVASVSHSTVGGELAAFTYTRSNLGSVTGVERTGTPQSLALVYDPAARVAQWSGSGVPPTGAAYTYDSIGNRLSSRTTGSLRLAAFDLANQIESFNDYAVAAIDPSQLRASADTFLSPGFEPTNAINGDSSDSLNAGIGWISSNEDVDHVLTIALGSPQTVTAIQLFLPTALGPARGLKLQIQTAAVAAWTAAQPVSVENAYVHPDGSFDTNGSHEVWIFIAATQLQGLQLTRPQGAGFTTAPAAYINSLAVAELTLYSATSTQTQFAYNGIGCCTQAGAQTFQYDPEGRLRRATDPASDIEYQYGGDGRLAVRIDHIAGVSTCFLFDGPALYGEYDSSGNPIRNYLLAPNEGGPIGFSIPGAPAPALHYYLCDERRSVAHVAADQGQLENTYVYDIFGNELQTSEATVQPLRFMGKIFDGQAGLYHWHMRTYLPNAGVFLQKDPLTGSANPYSFLGNDPATQSDPLGLGWLPNWVTKAVDTIVETAKELPGALYEDFSTGAARDRLAIFTVAAVDGGKDAVKAAVTGIVHTITHPVETVEHAAESINYTIWYPTDSVKDAVRSLTGAVRGVVQETEQLVQLARDDPDKFAEAVGRLTGKAMVDAVVSRATANAKGLLTEAATSVIRRSAALARVQGYLSSFSRAIRPPESFLAKENICAHNGDLLLPGDRPSWPAKVLRQLRKKYKYMEDKTADRVPGVLMAANDIDHVVPVIFIRQKIEDFVNGPAKVATKMAILAEQGYPVIGGAKGINQAAAAFYYHTLVDVRNLRVIPWFENLESGSPYARGFTADEVVKFSRGLKRLWKKGGAGIL